MYYVALDIGCIECGEDSNVLGIFKNKKHAEEVIKDHENRQKENWHGQHYFDIVEIEEIDKEYPIEY